MYLSLILFIVNFEIEKCLWQFWSVLTLFCALFMTHHVYNLFDTNHTHVLCMYVYIHAHINTHTHILHHVHPMEQLGSFRHPYERLITCAGILFTVKNSCVKSVILNLLTVTFFKSEARWGQDGCRRGLMQWMTKISYLLRLALCTS